MCSVHIHICIHKIWESPSLTDLTETHRVFKIMKILDFCASMWLGIGEHLDLLCQGKAAGNYALCQPWRLQKAQIWFSYSTSHIAYNFKVLTAD